MVSDNIINLIIRIQDEASKVSQKVEDQINKLGPTSQRTMDMWARAAEQAAKAMDTVHRALEKSRDAFQSLKNKGVDAFNNLKNNVNSAVTSFNNLISKSNTATLMMEKIKSVGNRVKTTLNTIKLPDTLQTGINIVTQKFETFRMTAGNTAENIKSKFTSAADTLSQKFAAASTAIQTHFSTISAHAKSVGSSVTTHMGNAFDKVVNKVSNTASTIRTKLSRAVDTVKSKVNQLAQSFQGMGGIVSSLFGAIGMAGIGQLTVGLAMTREQMTNLMQATMGSTKAAKEFVDTLDKMTNNSLVSLNDLGQAMNTIKMSTGMTNDELMSFAKTVNDVGQRAILMGKDSNEAMTIMQAAGRGLNGEFEILKTNFGITKDKLTTLGWTGAADDISGYQVALEKALSAGGNMNGMMNTTTGLIKQVEKGFTAAGRQIGETFIPFIQGALQWMLSLKNTSPEIYKLFILIAGAMSLFATAAPTLAPILSVFSTLTTLLGISAGSLLLLSGLLIAVGLAVYEVGIQFGWWSNATEMIGAVADGIRRLWEAFSNSPAVKHFIDDIKWAFQGVLTVVGALVSPLGLVLNRNDSGTIDIVSSIIGFFREWGEVIQWLVKIFGVAILLWKTAVGILYTYKTVVGIFQALSGQMTTLTSAAAKVVNAVNNIKTKFLSLKSTIAQVKNMLVSFKDKLANWTTTAIDVAKTKFNSLKTTISSAKVKLVELWATMKATAAEKISALATRFKTLAASISLAGIKAKLYAAYQWLVNAATAVWNALLAMNPITLVVIAIVALIAALVYLYNTNETVRNAIDGLWQGLQGLGQYIYGGLVGAWNNLVTALQGVASFFDGVLGNAIRGIIALLSGDTGGAVQYFTDAWNNLMTSLGPVGEFIQGVFSPIIQGLMDLLSGGGDSNPVDSITQGFTTLMEILSPIGEFMVGVFTPAWQLLMDIVTPLVSLFATLAAIFTQLISGQMSLQQAIVLAWTAIQNTISQILSNIINRVISWATSMWNNAVNTGSKFLLGVVSYISQLPGKIWVYLVNVVAKIASAGAQWISNAKSKASQVVSGVISYISQLPGKVGQEFLNIGSRMLSAGSQLVEKAKQIGRNIVNGMLNAMGIHSPGIIQEKVVLEFVNMIDRVKNQSHAASDAVKEVATNMIDTFKKQNLEDQLTVPDLTNADGGFLGDPLVGNALDEYDTTHIDETVDVTPTMNTDETGVLTENYALFGQNVSDIFNLMNTDSSLALANLTSANDLAYTTMSATEQAKMNLMTNHIRQSMSQILLSTQMGMNNAANVTRNGLNNMQNSTTRTTYAMINAWNTMKNSIISAASKIKTDATTHFNKLSETIGSFYRKLQNPSQWGGSEGGTVSTTRKVGHASKSNLFKNILGNYPSYMSYYELKKTPLDGPDIGDYVTKGKNNKVAIKDLLLTRGFAGSWEDTASPNVEYIKKVSREWDMKGPSVHAVGKNIDTGLAFKVKDFEGGTPHLSFQSFQNIAGAIFSPGGVPYEHYYNSDRYGSWQNALTNGSGCNCWDGAHALLALASMFGYGGTIAHGTWDGDGHVWAVINGVTMDTTAHQKGYGWTKPGVNSGPARHSSPNNLMDDFDIVKELQKNNEDNSNTKTSNSGESIVIVLDGQTKIQHEFINLPDGISEEEVVRIITKATDDPTWLKSLVQNMNFQDLDRKIKQKIEFRENRARGV